MKESLSIKVSKVHKAKLRSLAKKRKTTITHLMLEALEGVARDADADAPGSCYELTRDLFENPAMLDASMEGDRSTNKIRLRAMMGKR
jgi:hypothetical protein